MKRSKRIYILLGVLIVACAVTFGVSRYEAQKELIQNSNEVILEIPADSVQSLSWEYEDQTLAFHKDGTWLYDEDEAFEYVYDAWQGDNPGEEDEDMTVALLLDCFMELWHEYLRA